MMVVKKSTDFVFGYKKERKVSVRNIKFHGTIAKDFLFAACERFEASNLAIVDTSDSLEAHRDAIQICPFQG